jgi:hypothetical protein
MRSKVRFRYARCNCTVEEFQSALLNSGLSFYSGPAVIEVCIRDCYLGKKSNANEARGILSEDSARSAQIRDSTIKGAGHQNSNCWPLFAIAGARSRAGYHHICRPWRRTRRGMPTGAYRNRHSAISSGHFWPVKWEQCFRNHTSNRPVVREMRQENRASLCCFLPIRSQQFGRISTATFCVQFISSRNEGSDAISHRPELPLLRTNDSFQSALSSFGIWGINESYAGSGRARLRGRD